MEPAISIKNVSKSFVFSLPPIDTFINILGLSPRKEKDQIRILHNISADIEHGEIVGIVGANGAGKSTLLKLIHGTLTPNHGTVEINGKLAALIELGSGFNPELSGYENAMLYCLVQGVDKITAEQSLVKIEEFADIGEFFHKKIKTYSTGMFVRLAFAAAIQTNPDILVIDEALAVGDAKFVNKCFRRLEEFKAANKTLIMVSHDENTILTHCRRVILLHNGTVFYDGSPKEAMSKYNQLLFGEDNNNHSEPVEELNVKKSSKTLETRSDLEKYKASNGSTDRLPLSPFYNKYEKRSQTNKGSIFDVLLRRVTLGHSNVSTIMSGERLSLAFKIKANQNISKPVFGFDIHSASSVLLFGTNNRILKKNVQDLRANTSHSISFDFNVPLREGDYFLSLGFGFKNHNEDEIIDFREAVLHLKIADERVFDGILNLDTSFSYHPSSNS